VGPGKGRTGRFRTDLEPPVCCEGLPTVLAATCVPASGNRARTPSSPAFGRSTADQRRGLLAECCRLQGSLHTEHEGAEHKSDIPYARNPTQHYRHRVIATLDDIVRQWIARPKCTHERAMDGPSDIRNRLDSLRLVAGKRELKARSLACRSLHARSALKIFLAALKE
jgi:hypothetical protein